MKDKNEPVEMPAGVVDYWLEKAIEHNKEHPLKCSYCDEPIEKGDRFFYINAVNNEPSRKLFIPERNTFVEVSRIGHVTHLVPAPEREWAFDPEKQQPQPWEMDPSIPAPPKWEEWKERNRGVNYG